MSEYDEIRRDVEDFVSTLGESVKATPNENQYITTHIMKQIEFKAKKKPDEYLEGQRGHEPVIVFERNGLTIKKRVFHPSDVHGVDFTITKYTRSSTKGNFLGATAVQVKRNYGKTFFEFKKRDITQLKRFLEYWGSGYYLFVDETPSPPSFCFVRTSELFDVIVKTTNNPSILDFPQRVAIPNQDIRGYCRGLKLFYDLFYRCSRGEKLLHKTFLTRVKEYAKKTLRVVVELLIERER